MPNASLDNLFLAPPPLAPASSAAAPAASGNGDFDDALWRAGQSASTSNSTDDTAGDDADQIASTSPADVGDDTTTSGWPTSDQISTDQSATSSAAINESSPPSGRSNSGLRTGKTVGGKTDGSKPGNGDNGKNKAASSSAATDSSGNNAASQEAASSAAAANSSNGGSNSTDQTSTATATGSKSASTAAQLVAGSKTEAATKSAPSNQPAGTSSSSGATAGSEPSGTNNFPDGQAATINNSAEGAAGLPTAAAAKSQLGDGTQNTNTAAQIGPNGQAAANQGVELHASDPNFQAQTAAAEQNAAENPLTSDAARSELNDTDPDGGTANQLPWAPWLSSGESELEHAASSPASQNSVPLGDIIGALIDQSAENLSTASSPATSLLPTSSLAISASSSTFTSDAAKITTEKPSVSHAAEANKPGSIADGSSADFVPEAAVNSPAKLSTNDSPGTAVIAAPRDVTAQVDQARFVQRVANAFRVADDQGGEIRLRLSPPELGSLKVEVAVRNGVMTARLEAETTTARSLLLNNLPLLRERLAGQNIKIERFDVDLRQDARGQESPNQAPNFTGSRQNLPQQASSNRSSATTSPEHDHSTASSGSIGAVEQGWINVVV
jgi:flagellar hook-length control protein FliK